MGGIPNAVHTNRKTESSEAGWLRALSRVTETLTCFIRAGFLVPRCSSQELPGNSGNIRVCLAWMCV